MLTSRCEYRLLLRPDTARERLSELAHRYELIDEDQWQDAKSERFELETNLEQLGSLAVLPRQDHDELLTGLGMAPVSKPTTGAELLRRPGTTYAQIAAIAAQLGVPLLLPRSVSPERIESDVRYRAFLERESKEVDRQAALHDRALPETIVYRGLPGLRVEASLKLDLHRPRTIGEAGRLAGVTPADVGAILVYLARTNAQPVQA
jgi:tRNA uridine 5-carboxymethylaminomethyl modification enzyme